MSMISYAQNFEDVILWRALKHVERGFYIDIGAHDPVLDSVSLAFYEQGWRGVHVEPTVRYAVKIRNARPDEDVVEAAVGARDGAIAFFEVGDTGLSTGDAAIAQMHEGAGHVVKRVDVPCLPLSKLLDTYKDQGIHWLKIDVEGMEDQVIASWSPSSVRPWVVVVESTKPNSAEPSFAGWEPQLLALGYEFVYFDGLNRFYVSRNHPELKPSFGAGPNYFDDFVLGRHGNPFGRKINAELIALQQQLTAASEEAPRLSHALDAARAEAASQSVVFAQATSAWERASTTLTSEVALRNEAIAAREAEIARLNQHVAEMDASGQAAMARETALTQQLATREAEIVELKASGAALRAEVEQLTHDREADRALAVREHQAIYASRSSKITRPLRGIGRAVRGVAAAPKRITRISLEWLQGWLNSRPRLKRGALRMLRLVPPLERRLATFARTRGHGSANLPATAPRTWGIDPDPNALIQWRNIIESNKA